MEAMWYVTVGLIAVCIGILIGMKINQRMVFKVMDDFNKGRQELIK